uniref:Uncharacterized protein n=1 Tax=Arundo donax TaxID=35708 RepID=A0A0A9FHW2_ARUDO
MKRSTQPAKWLSLPHSSCALCRMCKLSLFPTTRNLSNSVQIRSPQI